VRDGWKKFVLVVAFLLIVSELMLWVLLWLLDHAG